MTNKVAFITDLHFGIRNDSIIFSDYQKKFYREFFFPKIKELGIDTIICGGDVCDRRKYISYDTMHRTEEFFFDYMEENDLHFVTIVGNHDVAFKSTNEVNSADLWYGKYPNVEAYSEAAHINIKGRDILMMPWIHNGNYQESLEVIAKSDAHLMIGHLELKGFEMDRGSFADTGMPYDGLEKFDLVISGHYHHRSFKDNVLYAGAPYQMTWADFGDDRGFHILDLDTLDFEFIKNPFDMFQKVYYDDELWLDIDWFKNHPFDAYTGVYIKLIVRSKTNPYWFDTFVEKINEAQPANLVIIEENVRFEGDDVLLDDSEDTMSMILRSCDTLEIEEPVSNSLKSLMRDLYQEAQTFE